MQKSDLKRSLFPPLGRCTLKKFPHTSAEHKLSLQFYLPVCVQSEVCCGVNKTSDVPGEMSALKSLYGNSVRRRDQGCSPHPCCFMWQLPVDLFETDKHNNTRK